MRIGFTGTRKGMSDFQQQSFIRVLHGYKPTHFLHGCCVGADEDAHHIVQIVNPYCKIIGYPCSIESMQSLVVRVCNELKEEKPPLDRNKDIVIDCDLLVACPETEAEVLRSGTWSTYRYAKKQFKGCILILPNGELR